MKKKIFTLFLALVASAGTMFAEVYNGTCGENLTWELNTETGTLTIQGSGNMDSYFWTPTPWHDYATLITQVILPEGIKGIGTLAFCDCVNLTTMNFPNSIEYVGESSFPNSITTALYNEHIFAYLPRTFSGEYVIPNGIGSIAMVAFADCENLTSIIIPNSVSKIGGWAFDGCSALTSITNYFSAPQKIDDSVFQDINLSSCTLYVLKESVNFYKVADVWEDFGQIIGVDAPQSIENTSVDLKSSKILRDGQIFILRGDKIYNAQGALVK